MCVVWLHLEAGTFLLDVVLVGRIWSISRGTNFKEYLNTQGLHIADLWLHTGKV